MLHDLVEKNRSYRRFDQSVTIPMEVLRELVDLARLSPSSGNLQSLRFMLFNGEDNHKVFAALTWKAYYIGENSPVEGERPSAYILMINDTEIMPDAGMNAAVAAQSILLGAVERGYGGCMFGKLKGRQLKRDLGLPDQYEVSLVVALGKPIETVVIEPAKPGGSIEYWTDDSLAHHVPKYSLDELIINKNFL